MMDNGKSLKVLSHPHTEVPNTMIFAMLLVLVIFAIPATLLIALFWIAAGIIDLLTCNYFRLRRWFEEPDPYAEERKGWNRIHEIIEGSGKFEKLCDTRRAPDLTNPENQRGIYDDFPLKR